MNITTLKTKKAITPQAAPPKPLDERVAAAFAPGGTTSKDVGELMGEVQSQLLKADDKFKAAKDRAMAPTTLAAGVAEARKEMEDASFDRERLEEAFRQLSIREQELKFEEGKKAAEAQYREAEKLRDEAVEALKQYPLLAIQISLIMAKVAKSDEALLDTRNKSDLPWLQTAEQVARGVTIDGIGPDRLLVRDVKLPAFDPQVERLWPPVSRF